MTVQELIEKLENLTIMSDAKIFIYSVDYDVYLGITDVGLDVGLEDNSQDVIITACE